MNKKRLKFINGLRNSEKKNSQHKEEQEKPYNLNIRPVEEMPEKLKKALRMAYEESFTSNDLEK